MDDDEDDDMGSPPLEDQMPREHSLPPHLQNPTSFMRTAPSASPPISNGLPNYHQRQHTPQAQMISRPGSRNSVSNVRRSSTSLGPSQLQQVSQASQAPNGYAYMRTPPINYQAAQGMPVAPHHAQQAPQPSQYYGQHPQATHPQVQQAYMQEQRRASLPPTFAQNDRQQQQQQPQHTSSPPQPEREQQSQDDQSQRLQKPAPAKSRSIFTPIDDSRSMLAQHWGIGTTTKEPKPEIKREKDTQPEAPQNQPLKTTPPIRSQRDPPIPKRTNSTDFQPPSRTDTAQSNAKRPRLKVQIPEEQSDADSATAGSSPRQSGVNTSDTPAKTSTDASHSSGTGVVLPPPSPSASAILSAGASGPPNPFARPHLPSGASQQNSQSYSSNNNNSIETPISALPSRFVADGLLPSPSSFFGEWGIFSRSGGDSNLLPSPLVNFPTPVMGGSSSKDDDGERKRKSPEQDGQEAKRVKI